MTEVGFWSRWVSPALNQPGLAWKMGPGNRPGFPDILYCIEGHSGLIELKYFDAPPVRPDTALTMDLRANQSAHLREWTHAGGTAYVLLGVARRWYLLPSGISDRRSMEYYVHEAYGGPQPFTTLRAGLSKKVLAYRN